MTYGKIVVAALLVVSMTSHAHAYIDPGTGSVVTTAILGFFAAIAYTFRKYMYRLKDLFTGRKTPIQPQRDVKTDR